MHVPIFNQLNDQDSAKIGQLIHPAHHKKGQIIEQSGTDNPRLLVLSRGRAKVVRTAPDGKQQIIGWLKPGDFTGEISVFTGQASDNEVVALEDSSFCTIDSRELKSVIATSPELSLAVIRELSKRLDNSYQQLESLGLMTAEQKIVARLTELAGGQTSFRLPISKQNLAGELGMAPETLSRKLKQLAQDGTIALTGARTISLLKTEPKD